ncbi:MAG: cysteine--tRNA ligase [Acidobacteria bacterium]|nr:cysteine--tRNA ligase [Acidobacteriota bacterium]
MRLYNTLTRQIEDFAPGDGETVRMYACGLTVYSRGHIGNFRTFTCLDVLRRALRHHKGFRMREVMNYTDVDDKTIAGAAREGVPLRDYTDRFIQAFADDATTLGLEPVEESPRATDEANMQAMSDMVAALERNGHTYRSDGSIYFKISTFPAYGRLSKLDESGIKPGARIDADSYDKQDARDFVLWKATRDGEPTWDLGVGPGRPGWHIECSAMALRLLGNPPIDIHAGGVDLIFPHHENEIAQSEAATAKPFARFWVHVEHLLMDDTKMSKSLGNIFTVREVIDRGHRASALRYLLISTHYRKRLKFSWESLAQAEEAMRRLMDFLARLDNVASQGAHARTAQRVAEARQAFGSMIEDDLNTAGALGVLFDLVRTLNSAIDGGDVGKPDVATIREAFESFDRVLGIVALRRREEQQAGVPAAEIERLIAERQDARRRRDFRRGDEIRDRLAARGIILEDTPGGTRWKLK